jgi:hypothetical protein
MRRRVASKELVTEAGGPGYVRTIKVSHVRKHLFPERVKDAVGVGAAIRPPEHTPPP